MDIRLRFRGRIRLAPASLILFTLLVGPVAAGEKGGDPLWCFVWITDTECHLMGHGEYLVPLIDAVKLHKPKMVLHTGDTEFEWANRGSWKDILAWYRSAEPPFEFHLSPGNHDDEPTLALKPWISKAATRGIYPIDTGERAEGKGYYKDRVVEEVFIPEWPEWNPEILANPNWQPDGGSPYRYVFRRGGIRFIIRDQFWREEHREWLRDEISRPDDSSVSIILQHKTRHYFPGEEDFPHNVKLVLSGHHEGYKLHEGEGGVTFITGAGIANGPDNESDAMVVWVYPDHLRMDRYVIPPGEPMKPVEGSYTIWTCEGAFSGYERPNAPVPVED
jgi:hypothetical protein